MNTTQELVNALKVIALDCNIREWLVANDPKALQQIEKAIKQGELELEYIKRRTA